MINLKIDPEFQSQIPPLTDDEFKQLEENILKEGKLLSPLIVWNNTLVDGHNRYAILQKHPEIYFSTIPLPFESREEVLAWICKNQLGRRNLTPEQKKFLIGKQYSVEHRKPGGNGNNQHTAAAKKTVPEELCQFDTIPPTASEASVRRQIAERNNVSESYVARSEKFMRGVEIMEQMVPGMQEKILSGQFKVRDADIHNRGFHSRQCSDLFFYLGGTIRAIQTFQDEYSFHFDLYYVFLIVQSLNLKDKKIIACAIILLNAQIPCR